LSQLQGLDLSQEGQSTIWENGTGSIAFISLMIIVI
jgi:hypothetical protein